MDDDERQYRQAKKRAQKYKEATKEYKLFFTSQYNRRYYAAHREEISRKRKEKRMREKMQKGG